MADSPPNVKIYDRPEPKRLSPALMIVIALVVLISGYFLYRAFVHPTAPPQRMGNTGIRIQTAFWKEPVPTDERRVAGARR